MELLPNTVVKVLTTKEADNMKARRRVPLLRAKKRYEERQIEGLFVYASDKWRWIFKGTYEHLSNEEG